MVCPWGGCCPAHAWGLPAGTADRPRVRASPRVGSVAIAGGLGALIASCLRYIGHCLITMFLLQPSYIQPFLLGLSGGFIRFISVYRDKVIPYKL